METTNLVSILVIVVAIMQVILFFKLWAMTNDVKKLREKLASASTSNFNFEIRKLLCSGNKQKAAELLENRFYTKIAELNYSGIEKSNSNYDQIVNNIDEDFVTLKKELEAQFKQIEVEVPARIKAMKSGNEFNELFG